MSTPRFKKDKEIIAEYESQVKGKGERASERASVRLGQCAPGDPLDHQLGLC